MDIPEQGELLDFHLYQALEMAAAPATRRPATRWSYLRRGYENLMRKTGFLSPDLRSRFLFQVP